MRIKERETHLTLLVHDDNDDDDNDDDHDKTFHVSPSLNFCTGIVILDILLLCYVLKCEKLLISFSTFVSKGRLLLVSNKNTCAFLLFAKYKYIP